jgi:hypothetical protein
MKKRLLFILCLFFVGANASVAQNRMVTNADLEKFRQKRLLSEKDYRENYAKLGFPSPEELEKLNVASSRERSELSRRLEAERAEREKTALLSRQVDAAEAQANYLQYRNQNGAFYQPNYTVGYSPFLYNNYGWRSGNFYGRPYSHNYYYRNNLPIYSRFPGVVLTINAPRLTIGGGNHGRRR